jgi:uncharacterized membrane protein (UPF0127 family)
VRRIAILFVTALLASACESTAAAPDRPPSAVTFEDQEAMSASTLFVEVADTPSEHRRGLMDVESLSADEGMAFVFDEPTDTTFWMKDTPIPLSVAFVGEDDVVIGVRDMQPCDADPCPTYGVDRPFVLAVEANLGWFADHAIGPGDRASFRESLDG